MGDHDPLCPAHNPNVAPQSCRCGLIARVRRDEQGNRTMQLDEARRMGYRRGASDERENTETKLAAMAMWCREDERETIAAALTDLGYDYAAEVARNGGRDE